MPIDTDIWRDLPEEKAIMLIRYKFMSADLIVDYSLKDLKNNHVVCVPGTRSILLMTLVTLLPWSLIYRIADKNIP